MKVEGGNILENLDILMSPKTLIYQPILLCQRAGIRGMQWWYLDYVEVP